MRSRLAALGAAGLLMVGGGWAWWALLRPVPIPRNVLLLTIDTIRTDRLGCYGSTRGLTPSLDALAADGARFARAFTPAVLTAPAHATMLTGRYPITHGLRNNGSEVLSEQEVLLPEILREGGFRTAAIVSALVLSSAFGLNQGFDLYYEKDISGSEKGHGLWYDQRPADRTVDRALAWLKAEGDRPFFLWVHLFDPHEPYDPPSPWKERYEKTPYDGEVAFTDAQAGRLLAALRDLGLYDDTLIIAAGDHGEGLGDHREMFHGVFLYNSTTHVPLIVRAPGGRRGVVVEDLASPLDVAPTILEALGVEPPAPMDGVSLLRAAARGGRVPARSLFLETIYPSASYGWAVVRALLEPSWKLISLPRPELYDLRADAAETTNRHDADPARVREMTAELERMVADLERSARQAETAAIDDETRDRLLSLGYVAGQQSLARQGRGRDPKEVAFVITPLGIARDLLQKGKHADAEEVFRKALEVDPDNKVALAQIGRALTLQGKLEEALSYFEHAVATYPDVEELYRTYGWVLLRSGRVPEAQAVFRRALEHLPESGHMHFLLGYAQFIRGEWKAALPELELAIRLSPRFGKPHYLAAICRLQSGDEQAAVASLEEYLKRDPDVESLFNDPYLESLRRKAAFQDMVKRYL